MVRNKGDYHVRHKIKTHSKSLFRWFYNIIIYIFYVLVLQSVYVEVVTISSFQCLDPWCFFSVIHSSLKTVYAAQGCDWSVEYGYERVYHAHPHLHTFIYTVKGNLAEPIHLLYICFWQLEWNQKTWKKPMKTQDLGWNRDLRAVRQPRYLLCQCATPWCF